jgi:hypothetical protein
MLASSRSVKVGLSARSCRTAPSRQQSVGMACACLCLTQIFSGRATYIRKLRFGGL